MSYEIELALLTKIIEEADIRSVIRQKVNEQFFAEPSLREVYAWLNRHYAQFGRVPTLRLVKREFPSFEPDDVDEDLHALVDEVKKEKLYADLSSSLVEITQAARDSPTDGFRVLREKAGELALMHGGQDDEDVTQTIRSVWEEYMAVKSGAGTVGIPWMWPYLNKVTLGKQRSEFFGFYARPKCMKTWVSLVDANFVHEQFGTVVGYASCEMPLPQIKRRLAALRSKVPYSELRTATLTDEEEKRFKLALEEIQDSPPFFLFQPTETGTAAISELCTKVEEYQLDLLWVDGFYELRDDDTHQAFRVIVRGLKKAIAEKYQIPVCGTTQANRSAVHVRGQNTTEVAFGDALAQVCDGLVRIIREPQHREMHELLFTMPALREAEGGTFAINAIPAVDFSEKFVLEGEDAEQALSDADDGSIT